MLRRRKKFPPWNPPPRRTIAATHCAIRHGESSTKLRQSLSIWNQTLFRCGAQLTEQSAVKPVSEAERQLNKTMGVVT
jgi:hypothetical protein